jgi:hypothetical protein
MLDRLKCLTAEILADTERRGAWMAPIALAGYFSYRLFPMPDAAFVNIGGAMAVILALHAFRLAPLEAVGTGLLVMLAGIAAVLAGDLQPARVMLGGLFLIATISTLSAWRDSRQPLDGALALGVSSELIAWALGNASRGTFGPDVALSAVGQAYGAFAMPGQWLLIIAAYSCACYNLRRKQP